MTSNSPTHDSRMRSRDRYSIRPKSPAIPYSKSHNEATVDKVVVATDAIAQLIEINSNTQIGYSTTATATAPALTWISAPWLAGP